MAVPVADLMRLGSGLCSPSDDVLRLLQADVPTDVAERPPDIARDQIYHTSRGGRESLQPQVGVHHLDGKIQTV